MAKKDCLSEPNKRRNQERGRKSARECENVEKGGKNYVIVILKVEI